MIRFACPGCSATFSVPDEKAGKHGKCPTCGSEFVIPEADPSAPPPLPGEAEPPPLPDPAPSKAGSAAVEVKPCPGCMGRLTVAPTDVGSEVECPYCKTQFRAERVGAAPAGEKPRPSLRKDEKDVDDRPRRPSLRKGDDDDDDDRPLPRRRRGYRGSGKKPEKLSAVGGIMLAGGIMALLVALGIGIGSGFACCLWPGTWYGFVVGILLIIRGSNLLGESPDYAPRGLAVCQIILIVNLDVINLILGILATVFLNDPEVKAYFGET